MLAYVTGSVDEELLARNEYLVTENRILRNQIQGRIRLTDPERISLASAPPNGWAGKGCSAFAGILEAVGIKAIKLPPRSPNLNANLERWHRSVKEECLSKLILFGEASLWKVLSQYVDHFHRERNHQSKGNLILFPMPADRIGELTGEIHTRERLGGMLKFYYRRAA
jgi:transposase InsO family protein